MVMYKKMYIYGKRDQAPKAVERDFVFFSNVVNDVLNDPVQIETTGQYKQTDKSTLNSFQVCSDRSACTSRFCLDNFCS